jgi:hypothetical protein
MAVKCERPLEPRGRCVLMSLSAAFYCVGEIMGEYGSQVMSFMVELALLAVKTYRISGAVSAMFL